MPRRREVAKRKILPDPKFQDRLLAKFINDMMRKGEKSVAAPRCASGALRMPHDALARAARLDQPSLHGNQRVDGRAGRKLARARQDERARSAQKANARNKSLARALRTRVREKGRRDRFSAESAM